MSSPSRVFGARAAIAAVGLTLGLGVGAVLPVTPAGAVHLQGSNDFGPYDQAKVDELMTQGFSEGEALFIALTKVEGKAIGGDRVRLTSTFPTGNQAVINIRVVPTSGTTPNKLKIKTGSSGANFKFSLKYFVPFDKIPVESRPTIALGDPATGHVALVAYSAVPADVVDARGVNVVVGGVVDQLRGDKVDHFVTYLGDKLNNAKLDKLNGKLKAGLVVKDVIDMGAELDGYLTEINRLEKCAKNPTDPLTKKAYQNDPEERARILNQIESVRAELKGNAAAGVIGTINSAGAGLIKSAPWLGYIIGPGTAWALDNFKQVAQDRLNELRKGITSCEGDLKINALGATAVKCDGPVGAWTVDIEATNATGHGVATFALGEDLSGAYAFSGISHVLGEDVPFSETGSVHYTASADGKSGTLGLSLRGSVLPVTVGKFCKDGAPLGG